MEKVADAWLGHHPEDGPIRATRAMAHWFEGRRAESAVDAARALAATVRVRRWADGPGPFVRRSKWLGSLRLWQAAADDAAAAVAFDERSVAHWLLLARACLAAGDLPRFREAVARGLTLNADKAEASLEYEPTPENLSRANTWHGWRASGPANRPTPRGGGPDEEDGPEGPEELGLSQHPRCRASYVPAATPRRSSTFRPR